MCNPILKDVNNQVWQLGVQDSGRLYTTPTLIRPQLVIGTVLVDPANGYWRLDVGTDGRLLMNTTLPSIIGIPYVAMTSTNGLFYNLVATTDGRYDTVSTNFQLPDVIPIPLDVSMSRWPQNIGVVCTTCGNAPVTVSADMSCWCCTCNSFVSDEDTNIIVILDA